MEEISCEETKKNGLSWETKRGGGTSERAGQKMRGIGGSG